MKIAIPVQKDEGIDSKVYGHFGSAPMFAVYDSQADSVQVSANPNEHHEHGHCMPAQAMTSLGVEAVISGGMGRNAIVKLTSAGIKVYFADNLTSVADAVKAYKAGELTELSLENACAGHEGHEH